MGGVCVLTAWFGSVHVRGRCGDGDGGYRMSRCVDFTVSTDSDHQPLLRSGKRNIFLNLFPLHLFYL